MLFLALLMAANPPKPHIPGIPTELTPKEEVELVHAAFDLQATIPEGKWSCGTIALERRQFITCTSDQSGGNTMCAITGSGDQHRLVMEVWSGPTLDQMATVGEHIRRLAVCTAARTEGTATLITPERYPLLF